MLVLHMPLSPLPTHLSPPCPLHSTEVGATRFETPSPSPDTVDPHTGNPTPEHTETELMPRSSLDPDPSPRSALSNLVITGFASEHDAERSIMLRVGSFNCNKMSFADFRASFSSLTSYVGLDVLCVQETKSWKEDPILEHWSVYLGVRTVHSDTSRKE